MRRAQISSALLLLSVPWVGCGPLDEPQAETVTLLPREACADRDENRQALFGDLHVHTAFSFDARSYHTILTPADAYRFAKGETVGLPPLDSQLKGTRQLQLDRPLDFAAVTDHGEFLGEIALCTEPDSPKYDGAFCTNYRTEIGHGAFDFGFITSSLDPKRMPELCGEEGTGCQEAARGRWRAMQEAAETHYDRSSSCTFSSLIAYEYTNTANVSNLHRNIIFKNEIVPDLPITHLEAPSPLALWQQLDRACRSDDTPCDVVALPHNSNLSNGNLFDPTYPGGDSIEEERSHAELRARMEPVVEVFQHKGDSECRNGFPEVNAQPDPLCDFEKLRPKDDELCGEKVGKLGMRLWGCVHRHDFVRNVLSTGLLEEERIGQNPFALGFIGSTDTHNGIPGFVRSDDFAGHVGLADDTSDKLLGDGTVTHDTLINNPGGLAGVWAEENSRDAIFDALMRRETFATSGPRIVVRFFGGWSYPSEMCAASSRIADAYAGGVPMGGELDSDNRGDASPNFLIQAEHDAGSGQHPGQLLQHLQVIKGWTEGGKAYQKIYPAAGDPNNGASVDASTCKTTGPGEKTLCTMWSDPDFDPSQRAFYYARVMENPSCRWNSYECNRLDESSRPAACDQEAVTKVVQQRAWSSPIWYRP